MRFFIAHSFISKSSLLLGCLCAFLCAEFAFAEQRELKSDAVEQVDAVLLLDASGSMLINDPQRLRDEGARLFAQFLKAGDRLAVVRFAEDASVVQPLTPFDSNGLEGILKQISEIGSTGEYTDILAGIKVSRDILKQQARKEARPIIILLSDGKMDPSPAKGTATAFSAQLLGVELPMMKNEGIRVYTLAFSEDADNDLLSQISASTDGASWFTPNADKVHESFASLFLTVKKPQVIPLGGKAFNIDADVQEATFYVNREEGQEVSIQSPSGRKITADSQEPNIKWYEGQKFDVVTLTAPEVGSWQVTGISPQEGFATILTNLKLVTDWPISVDAGGSQLLQARLYEGQKPIALPEMTDAVRYAFQITPTDKVSEPIMRELMVDDGTHGDKIAHDGIYSYTIKLEDSGEYKLRVLAKAPTFERQQQIPFRVKPEVIAVHVLAKGEAATDAKQEEVKAEAAADSEGSEKWASKVSGNGESVVEVILSEETRGFKNVQVKLIAIDAGRNRYMLPIVKSAENPLLYEITAATLPREGRYELQAILTGEGRNRTERKDRSRPVLFTLLTADSKGAEDEAVLVVEKPKGPTIWERLPFFEVILISLVNFGAGITALKLLRKAQGKAATEVPDYPVPQKLLAGIEALEKKTQIKEVDLNSPMFNEEPAAAAQPAAAPSEAEEGAAPMQPEDEAGALAQQIQAEEEGAEAEDLPPEAG